MSYTKGPWHVNAIDSKRKRLVGDETSTGWDKLQINSAHNTIATVYHRDDARLIADAPEMRTALEAIIARIDGDYDHPSLKKFGPLKDLMLNDIYDIAIAAIAKATAVDLLD